MTIQDCGPRGTSEAPPPGWSTAIVEALSLPAAMDGGGMPAHHPLALDRARPAAGPAASAGHCAFSFPFFPPSTPFTSPHVVPRARPVHLVPPRGGAWGRRDGGTGRACMIVAGGRTASAARRHPPRLGCPDGRRPPADAAPNAHQLSTVTLLQLWTFMLLVRFFSLLAAGVFLGVGSFLFRVCVCGRLPLCYDPVLTFTPSLSVCFCCGRPPGLSLAPALPFLFFFGRGVFLSCRCR